MWVGYLRDYMVWLMPLKGSVMGLIVTEYCVCEMFKDLRNAWISWFKSNRVYKFWYELRHKEFNLQNSITLFFIAFFTYFLRS